MAIIRGKRPEDGYTLVLTSLLRDPRLSYKSKGIMAGILSHRDDYDLTVEQLIVESRDGPDSVYTGLKELVKVGYLRMERRRDEGGHLRETDFIVQDPPPYERARRTRPGKSRPGSDQGKSNDVDETRSGKSRSGETRSGKPSSGKSETKNTTGVEDHGKEQPPPEPPEPRRAPSDADSTAAPPADVVVVDDSSAQTPTDHAVQATALLDELLGRAGVSADKQPIPRHRAELVDLIAAKLGHGWPARRIVDGIEGQGPICDDKTKIVFGALRWKITNLGDTPPSASLVPQQPDGWARCPLPGHEAYPAHNCGVCRSEALVNTAVVRRKGRRAGQAVA